MIDVVKKSTQPVKNSSPLISKNWPTKTDHEKVVTVAVLILVVVAKIYNRSTQTISSLSPVSILPSTCAAPPSVTLVTNIPLSPTTCWLPMPPAMLKPRPAIINMKLHANSVSSRKVPDALKRSENVENSHCMTQYKYKYN